MVHVTSATNISVDSPQGRKLFVFDRVFGEDVGQDGIWGYINDSVNSFVQGYNVSILAYGQSGSGKSYTMGTSGPQDYNAKEALGMLFVLHHVAFVPLTSILVQDGCNTKWSTEVDSCE